MDEVEKDIQRKPPYVAAGTLWEFLNKLKSVSTPAHLDAKEIEEYGVPKHWAYHLLSALKFLNLVEKNGKTTEALKSLQMRGEEFKPNLEKVVRNAYSELFTKVDPIRDTRSTMMNYFMKHYGISPSGAEKATTLFLDLCNQAGIPTSQEKLSTTSRTKNVSNKSKIITLDSSTDELHISKNPLSESELKNVYIKSLIEKISPVNTNGKDAEAIKAEAELRKAELDRIERLLNLLPKGENT